VRGTLCFGVHLSVGQRDGAVDALGDAATAADVARWGRAGGRRRCAAHHRRAIYF